MENKFLQKLDYSSKYNYLQLDILRTIFNRNDAVSIIKEIFPELEKREYLKNIAFSFLPFFLSHNEIFLKESTYLIKKKLINIQALDQDTFKKLIYNIPDMIDMIIKDLKELFKGVAKRQSLGLAIRDKLNILTTYVISKRLDLWEIYLNSLVDLGIPEILRGLFIGIIQNETSFDYNLIINALKNHKQREDDHSFSDLPYALSEFIHHSEELKAFLVANFEELFRYEKSHKLPFLFEMKRFIPYSILKEYEYLLKLINVSAYRENNADINTILINNAESFIKDYIGDNTVVLLGDGTTAEAFRIGEDKALKFASKKYDEETEKEHFLLAPTEELIIKDDEGKILLHIEKQKYHRKVYNNIPINKEDLNNYFKELAKYGLEIQDPHCEARRFDNFGFLDDYHEATLVGVNSHEELPDWFKERPLVLFDIDMVKKKEKTP